MVLVALAETAVRQTMERLGSIQLFVMAGVVVAGLADIAGLAGPEEITTAPLTVRPLDRLAAMALAVVAVVAVVLLDSSAM
jgi:hypothetical protein